VDAATHPTGAAGDVNGIGRFTPFEDDLVATKEGGFCARLQHPPLLQVDHSVEG
jgi:hypothetical protein